MSALTVTFDSEISIVTTIKELARLRRIEQAARHIWPYVECDQLEDWDDSPYQVSIRELRAALEAKP